MENIKIEIHIEFKIILLFLITVALILNITNCSEIVDPPLNNKILDTAKSYTHFLWPSKKGSYWIYDNYRIYDDNNFPIGNNDSNWTYINFKSFGIDLDTVKIQPTIYQTEISDSIYITLNDTVYPCFVFNNGFRIPYYSGQDGIYNLGIFEEGGDTLIHKGMFLPAQIELNKPWIAQFVARGPSGFFAIQPIDKRLISLNDTITTSLGEFVCHVIKTRIIEADDYPGYLDFYEYYSPNIGLIAKVRIFILPKAYWFLDYIEVLKEYNLNN